jgi:hypothetical protein
MPFGKRKQGNKILVVNTDTGDVKGTHDSEADADKQLAALHANDADKDKGHMDIQTKAMAAEVVPVEGDESGPGTLHVIASSPRLDRDGEQLWADEWETPLPEHIQILGDHDNRHVLSTVGSGTPTMEADNKIHVRGTYAETDYAQQVRKLVNGKHLRHLSAAFREKKTQKGVSRELINASFVNVPSNTDAVVLESKSFDEMSDETKAVIEAVVKEAVAETLKMISNLTGVEIKGLSQAPEGAPSKDADPQADPANDEAAALAKAKAAAFQITSETRQYTEEELQNA